MMIGLAIIARPLVLLLLTDKWAACIPYLQLLCVGGLLFPLHMMNLNVLQALGRSDLFLKLEIVKKAMIAVNIAVTWRWGISAMIYGMILMSLFALYLNSYYNGILVGYSLKEQLLDMFPYLFAAAVMGAAVYGLGLLHLAHHWSLLLQVGSGMLVYVFLCRALRLHSFMSLWDAGWARIRTSKSSVVRVKNISGL